MRDRIIDRPRSLEDFELWIKIHIGTFPSTNDDNKIAVDWFTHQTDEIGAVARAEMARREALET